ncbi:MAG: TonB-dependent receptor [Bacteroidia bacterium]|nr:TonB-dependent receptor [Bacteroidia bacterium]
MKTVRGICFLVAILCCASLTSQAQQKFTISGYIKDAQSGETLPGANAYVKETHQGTNSNTYGFFSLSLPKAKYTFIVSFLGYEEFSQTIDLSKDVKLNVNLKTKSVQSKEVEIVGEKTEGNINSTDMGRLTVPMEMVKKLPAFFGEVDLVKVMQMVPGVKNGGEGNTGMYVRGGGPDQNLVLLDEAVVYNGAHLLGFFSVFNSDAIKTVDLHKGGMPAQYGGRLASVLDISMKEGNDKKYKVNGGIGLISSRLTVQGPIKKDTASFIVSARRTYIDVLIQPFIKDDAPTKGSGYFFYDLNTKVNYRLSEKDRLYLSAYFGRDVFSFKSKNSGLNIKVPWGNATASARWNHLFSSKLFLNTSLIFSDYDFESDIRQMVFAFKVKSGVRDYNAKLDFNWYPDIKHQVKFGANYIFHRYAPNNANGSFGEQEINFGPAVYLYAHEAALYASDDFDLTDKLRFHAGLRGSFFQQVGPFTRYVKDQQGATIDTLVYGKRQPVKHYLNAEPRLMMRYTINKKSSLKASYTQNYQYMQITSLANQSLPTDLWYPATSLVKPQFGTQYSLGYFRNFFDNTWESSVETYYKEMKNQVEFKDGALPSTGIGDNLDNQLTFGHGWSYGAEFFLKKVHGKTTGWIGYSLSWTVRNFPQLNNGKNYFARYDRRHDLSLVLTHDLNSRWSFSAIFVYASGSLLWMPTSIYLMEGQPVVNYGARNNFRMPPYHRLDLSATWTGRTDRKVHSSWNFSIYNVYSRLNPYFMYVYTEGNPADGSFKSQAKMVSIFPIIPSVTYNFSF